jgi:hypothetical protein
LPENNVYNTTTVELFKDSLYSILIILIYIMNSFLVSFSRVLGKVLMELNYISPYSIIILIGILGLILTSILLALSSIFSCEGKTIKSKCNVYDKNKTNINNERYFDSIPIYFYNLKIILDDESNSYKFYIEILLLTPIYLFTNFMEFNYEILLIYYLNPIYILISDTLYYGTKSLLYTILTHNNNNNLISSILTEIADLVAFLGYLIYLEIIELRFCGLNKNLRKHIRKRSKTDNEIEFGEIGFANDNENEDNNSILSS